MTGKLRIVVCVILLGLLANMTTTMAVEENFMIKDEILLKYTGPGGNVVIPDGVKQIAPYAFSPDSADSPCYTKLISVTLPDGVEEIGVGAFSDCVSLESVTLPSSIVEIGAGAFSNCKNLKSVAIPSGVKNLYDRTFGGCTNLKDVSFPKSQVRICGAVFENTAWLKNLGDFAVIQDSLLKYQGKEKDVTVPAGIAIIGDYAFHSEKGKSYIKTVTIPEGVTEIGQEAFFNCTTLTKVTIPATVTHIEDDAFLYCNDFHEYVPLKGLTIHGASGSYAEKYAAENKISFVASLPQVVDHSALEENVPKSDISTAYASDQSVLVNDVPINFQMYALKDEKGNPTNYVKLRDVASVLNGTPAQFDVSWDGTVNILNGQAYTPNGSEMTTPFSGNRTYAPATAPTKVNGKEIDIDAIVLEDDQGGAYTYYKLRDLGNALGFKVDWSTEKGIFVETE